MALSRIKAALTSRKRLRKLMSFLLPLGAFLLVMFQNFQVIPLDRLKPDFSYARAVSPTDGTGDIRRLAPARVEKREQPVLASPQAGSDINSISQDWATRQAHLITGGAEERLLASFNRKMNRMLNFEPVEGEPWPESGYDSSDSGDDESDGHSPSSSDDESDSAGFRPASMQLVAMNRVQLALKNHTKVSCSIEGSGVRWDVSRPINNRLDVNFRHESSEARSSLHLNYSW